MTNSALPGNVCDAYLKFVGRIKIDLVTFAHVDHAVIGRQPQRSRRWEQPGKILQQVIDQAQLRPPRVGCDASPVPDKVKFAKIAIDQGWPTASRRSSGFGNGIPAGKCWPVRSAS
jgi:hypothetical protein